jgi:5-hydroxyisourate hydrolase-like protein (transthyretin family)
MTMSKKALKKIATYMVVAVLLSILELVPVPSAMAATPSISINPTLGVVGDMVTASGQINTTDGAFTIRWNQAFNFTGVAVGNNFTRSLSVPSTAGGNIVVELIDEALDIVVATADFTLLAKFSISLDTLPSPRQLQEGNKTSVKINVTGGLPNTRYPANITVKDPANQTHFAIVLLSNTTVTGAGNGTASFPTDFGTGAHTNLAGTYFASSNVTGVETAEFFVGLTDKTGYQRKENVRIQAAGYKGSEKVKVDIRTSVSVSSFPQNVTASSSGLITLTWSVPVNATSGTYHVILTNTTADGTVKMPTDTQDFAILGFACLVQAKNLAGEAVEGASIKVYNASATTTVLNEGLTNSTGWIMFNRDEGNYTFKAFFRNVEVGLRANELIIADTELHMNLSLTNFLVTVRTEEGEGVPLIDIALAENKTRAESAGQTNATGMTVIKNLFTNRTYRIEATRYGLLFSNMTLEVVPFPEGGLIIHSLTLWNQQLNVHTVDAEDESAVGVDIRVYEWTSGTATPLDSATTDFSGDVFLSLPFGRYILRAFKGDDFLSEIVVDLDEPTALTFDLATLNVNVIVSVLDYFGQPLANAEVKIERKIGQDFVLISTKLTDTAGTAQFVEMVGGDSRVSVNLGGTLVAVKTQFLGAGSSEVAIKVAEYVAIAGYPLQTGAFALLIFILVVIVVVLVAARKRVMQVFQRSSKR